MFKVGKKEEHKGKMCTFFGCEDPLTLEKERREGVQ